MSKIQSIVKPDILPIIERAGVILKKQGSVYKGLCPLHEERTPSFQVNSETQLFRCWGCGESGDVVTFVQKFYRIDFKKAIEILGISRTKALPSNPREIKKRDLLKNFRTWESVYLGELSDRYREIQAKTRDLITMEQVGVVSALFHELPIAEYHLDILSNGDDELKYELYRSIIKNGK